MITKRALRSSFKKTDKTMLLKTSDSSSQKKNPSTTTTSTTTVVHKKSVPSPKKKSLAPTLSRARTPSKRASSKKKSNGALTPTKLDAVFGRGRKKNHVRNGSLYRSLVEKHWPTYANMDPAAHQKRKDFVRKSIVNVMLSRGGRFIMRLNGPHEMHLLDPSKDVDLKLIFKKIQRALFNEKKRQELSGSVPIVDSSESTEMTEEETEFEESEAKLLLHLWPEVRVVLVAADVERVALDFEIH